MLGLLKASSWLPTARLDSAQLTALLTLARESGEALRAIPVEERLGPLVRSVTLETYEIDLAANCLDLILQMHHGGLQVRQLVAEDLVPLFDAHSGCYALLIVDRSVVHLRIRSSDVTALRSAAEDLLSLLRVDERVTSDVAGRSGRLRVSNRLVIQSNRAGEEEARGEVHALSRLGLIWYSAAHGVTAVLWTITLGLTLLSILSALLLPSSTPPFITWLHDGIDRIFTGTLGAALVATITQA
ncbi:hypothetical protein, partial [Mesorhizobium japonicum]|uniref:hypothetical protein n=1 Tax=Mesorhizobium japonicum TaxID=2066070 RepID=UPI003B5AD277